MKLDNCSSDGPERKCSTEQPILINESIYRGKSIDIQPLDFGYLVIVGCQKFAVETSEKLVENLGEYLKDPAGVEKKWFDGKFLK